MTRKLLAGLCAIAFASLSTAAFAACAGHSVTASTSTPVQTADISTSSQSQDSEQD